MKTEPSEKSLITTFAWLLGVPVFALAAMFMFWMFGGIRWLETKVFPPQRPHFMPLNSIWIDGLPLPISWHHGWWFGCSQSPSGTTNYCRLVVANGAEVYAGEYLPCSSRSPIQEASIRLVPPDAQDLWLFRRGIDAPLGFLEGGDLLVPVAVWSECESIKAGLRH